jgi:beta-phosphoglucomutase
VTVLKAIIFDCDGVIANTEPIHMAALQRLLSEEGITVSREDYFEHYLALDDRGCFLKAFGERGISLTSDALDELIRRKSAYVEPVMRETLELLPGSAEFIRRAALEYPLAVASGALKHEIVLVLKYGGLRDCFQVIISAEDVARGKPHPDPFVKACRELSALSEDPIDPSECLVIEDSIHGVRAAIEAGMRCLAVTNSYPSRHLVEAHLVIDSLAEISLNDLREMFTS